MFPSQIYCNSLIKRWALTTFVHNYIPFPLSRLNEMYKQSIEAHIPNVYSAEQRLHYIIQDIAFHRLFKPAKINCAVENKRSFMNIHFDNKGLDAINIGNILNNKHIKAQNTSLF